MSQVIGSQTFPPGSVGIASLAALRRKLRRVLWWAVTLQLHTQFGFWLRARRLRRASPPALVPALIGTTLAEQIAVPHAEAPLVSVIIPTHGHVDFTLRCLASIAARLPEAAIEVIVVDDAGPADQAVPLTKVKGIRLLRHDANLGFIGTCNAAARVARGQYLLFLNNDTQVLPGWLDTMLIPFRTRDDVGAVGSMLLYPDGRLQEAGAIIWSDGTGWNFGRMEDPGCSIFNYTREVDYCSGASLLVRRSIFARLGGFDTDYTPAYYEDTDLCFRLREQGLKTIYQPRSHIVHFEGVSHGRDVAIGVKSCQVTNQKTFLRRWGDFLARVHYVPGTHVMRARDRAFGRQIVLVVDHRMPEPDRDAGSRAMLCCLQALLAAGLVVKFWPHDLIYCQGYTEALQDMGVEVFHGPNHILFERWIEINGSDVDHVLLSRPDVAEDCLALVRQHSRARVIYYGHDLHFRRLRQLGEVRLDERLLHEADAMEDRERAIWRAADTVLYLSEEEAGIVEALEPSARARAVVPFCFSDFAAPRSAPAAPSLLFVGGFGHPPNEDAVCWFAAEILPLVRAVVPGACLTVAGSNPTARVRALAGIGVTVTGSVSETMLRRLYAEARVAVVPLRCGAGVKLKVIEALVEGTPLVTTPVGAQGLQGLQAVAPVACDPAAFADAVCALLLNDALWQARSVAGVTYAEARFRPEMLRQSLLAALGITVSRTLAEAA